MARGPKLKSKSVPSAQSVGDGTIDGETDGLIRFLDDWKSRKVVVVGDFMLDQYVYGNAVRLSPDAPVPVLAVEREEHQPGGAANVCLDLLTLGCRVAPIGLVGQDDAGRRLKAMLKNAGCQTPGLVAVKGRPTTTKQNFVGLAQHRHPQKMFRADRETKRPIDDALADRLLDKTKLALRGAAVLCIEDYNKGVLTESFCQKLIKLAKGMGVPVLIDPASLDDYRKYRGATCITPNRTEAGRATGIGNGSSDPQISEQLIERLMADLKLESVVLTLDKHGAMLLEKGKPIVSVPTQARSVYDVTGAGDMVLAMLAGAIANGADWVTAVQLANVAAGLEVERFGVVPITLGEVLLQILSQQHESIGKLRSLDALLRELEAHRADGKRIVFTNGCFDILHAGHVSFLREARRQGDLLVLGLNSDASVRRLKGKSRPVHELNERATVISELSSVDYVVVFEQDTPVNLLKKIRPDVLVKGGDYTVEQVVGGDLVQAYGGEVVVTGLVDGLSSTNAISKLKGG